MNILTIGTDKNLFNPESEAAKRIKEYGRLFEELHIIVFSKCDANNSNCAPMMRLMNNVFVYPTNSKNRFYFIADAYKLGINLINIKRVTKNAIDIISAQDASECGLVSWLLKRKFGLKLQLQIHTDIFSSDYYKESFLNSLRYHLARFLLNRADGIRVVSERLKNYLEIKKTARTFRWQWRFKAKIALLPIWTDIKFFQTAPIKINLRFKYQDNFIVLMASRFSKEKNIALAIRAFSELVSQFPKMFLLIVGEGPEYKKLNNLVYNLGLDDNIKFEDWTDDLVSYYKTSDIFLITSNYEGWARTAIEALACGLPVFMTDVGCAFEIVKPYYNGMVFDVGNKKQLITAFIELMKNKELLGSLKQNTISSINHLAISKAEYLEKYKKILEELL